MVELRCKDGKPMTDKPGDGQRLLEALPAALDAIRKGTSGRRLVFVHCQQGRSRAGSIATAHLLATHAQWTLYDAVAFLAARRPETEISEDYIHALEQWAVGKLGRAPSLPRIRAELPRQIRPSPRGVPPPIAELDLDDEALGLAVELESPPAEGALDGAPTAATIAAITKGIAALPPNSPLKSGSFGAAAIRRASPARPA